MDQKCNAVNSQCHTKIFIKIIIGTSLAVQIKLHTVWVRLHTVNAGGPGFDPWWGD